MKRIFLSTILLLLLFSLQAQNNNIVVRISGTAFQITSALPTTADFTSPITVSLSGPTCTNFNVVERAGGASLISTPVRQGNSSFLFTVSDPASTSVFIILSCDGIQTSPPIEVKNAAAPSGGGGGGGGGGDAFSYFYNTPATASFFRNFYRYNRKDNKAYFFFDEAGMLLGPAPVNIDADDYIIVYVAVRQNEAASYSIQVDGEYNPSDLTIRPSENILSGAAQSNQGANPYTFIVQTFGPFTSDYATIKVNKSGSELKSLDAKINKLYNVAIGASFITTNLEKPSFDLFPLSSTSNTINSKNNKDRTLATFNVIFYWKSSIDWVMGKLKGNSHITRGRDILKEPLFWERLNPIFGVSLNGDWNENFFFGGNFEFARGGSLTAGWHYGKIQELADENFILGQTQFTGTVDDIKLTNTWDSGFFFGITLDTRIFNRLFARN